MKIYISVLAICLLIAVVSSLNNEKDNKTGGEADKMTVRADSAMNAYLKKLNYKTSQKTPKQAMESVSDFICYRPAEMPNNFTFTANGNIHRPEKAKKHFDNYDKMRERITERDAWIREAVNACLTYRSELRADSIKLARRPNSATSTIRAKNRAQLSYINSRISELKSRYYYLDSCSNLSRAQLYWIKYLNQHSN